MLETYSKQLTESAEIENKGTPQFLSRVFTDQKGRQFRMTFLVAVVGGELKGRLVSVEPIANSLRGTSEGVICLPITCNSEKPDTEFVSPYIPVVSPYTELFFFTSQPTRAPSFK
jgi:hypothetical protein